jgi:alcohol dehydrogenase (cytochrome c)/quinohemoprotein ethanol dehydrogenase
MREFTRVGAAVVVALALAGCNRSEQQAPAAASSPPPPSTAAATSPRLTVAEVDGAAIAAADSHPGDWLSTGRTYSEQRYSPLAAINADNVARLGLAWSFDLDSNRGQEATPIVVDGVMYVSTAWSMVKALDAATGKLLWSYDPEVPRAKVIDACCDAVNRGVAIWQGKVFVGSLDGRLIALDATNGTLLWQVQTTDPAKRYTITGAPRVVKGKVIIGNGGAEFSVRGYVTAYDAGSGSQLWRFYTVPGDPSQPQDNPIHEMTAKTWNGEWWKYGGGGTAWDSFAFDPELDLLYVGTGNGSPWNQAIRSPGGGDNLFLSSIVALRPDTGEYVWHYQTTPGDTWDYTATQHMILADLPIDGATRKVIMQAPKNGFFYVLDRATGALISAEPFIQVNWAERVDPTSGRPVEHPEARYYQTGKTWTSVPGPAGAHSWQPMAFHPGTGLVYLPVQETGFPYAAEASLTLSTRRFDTGVDFVQASLPTDPKVVAQILEGVNGHLAAWDPVAQKEVWRAKHLGPSNGGVLATAGNLVFQGTAAGNFEAYRADTGAPLWSAPTRTGVLAAPITYTVDGEQYVAVAAGGGGIFALAPGPVGDPQHQRGARLQPRRDRHLARSRGDAAGVQSTGGDRYRGKRRARS